MGTFIRLEPIDTPDLTNTKILKADQYKTYLEARTLIERAKKKAAEIRAEAKEEFKLQQKLGFEKGMEEGRAQIAEQILTTVESTVTYFATVENQMVDLVISCLRKIMGEFQPGELVVDVIHNSLDMIRQQKQVTIRVSPREVDYVRESFKEMLSDYSSINFIEIVADARLDPGDCILESEIGVIDASVEKQLQALEKAFKKSIGTHHNLETIE